VTDDALTQPAARATRAATDAMQLLYRIRDTLPLKQWEAANEAIAHLADVPIEVAVLLAYVEQTERDMKTMIDENNMTHRDLSSTHEKCAALLAMLHTANVRAAAAERMISFDSPQIAAGAN
jgi:hypothetical protein